MASRPPQPLPPDAPSRATSTFRRARPQTAAAGPSVTRSRPHLQQPLDTYRRADSSPDHDIFAADADVEVEAETAGAGAPPFSIRRTLFPSQSGSGRRDASAGSLRRGQQARTGNSVADAFTTPSQSVGASLAHTFTMAAAQPSAARVSDPEDDILVRDAKGNVSTAFTSADVTHLLSAGMLEDDGDEGEGEGEDGAPVVDMSVLDRYRSKTGLGIDQAELEAALGLSLREKLASLEEDRWMYEPVDIDDEP